MLPLLTILALLPGPAAASGQPPPNGVAPRGLGVLSSAAWVPLDGSVDETPGCRIRSSTWDCPQVPPDARGVVVLVGAKGVTMTPVGLSVAAARIGTWGRVVRFVPGGAGAEALHDLRVGAWKPERSAVRPKSRRFLQTEESAVSVIPLGTGAVWAGGESPDPDAYLLAEGPQVSSIVVPLASLAGGPPDVPEIMPAAAPFPLTGRIETESGQAVDDATVDLFAPLVTSADDPAPLPERSLIRRATTHTDASGAFAFPNLDAAVYYIVATTPSDGRGAEEVHGLGPPVVVQLTPPRRVRGRVIRRSLPVPGARVRFLADPLVWTGSADATTHIAGQTESGIDGRFTLALPVDPAGSVQIVAPDGSVAVRRPVPSGSDDDVELGDVVIPEPRRVTLRLLNGDAGCTLIATGPLSGMGLSVVKRTGTAGLYWFDLPESGAWALSAECGGQDVGVQPAMITVPPDGPVPMIDLVLLPPAPRRDRRRPGPPPPSVAFLDAAGSA